MRSKTGVFAAALPPLVLVAVVLGGWEAACRLLNIPVYLLPSPSAIGIAIGEHLPLLLQSALTTLWAAFAALVWAFAAGSALALLGGFSPMFRRAFGPLAAVIQVTPVVALGPLFVIWAGLDHPGRALTTLWPSSRSTPAWPAASPPPIRIWSACSIFMTPAACGGSPTSTFPPPFRTCCRG
jgi:ABC-type nitrate/sulfonate/bicarbonate transport system permease component